MTRGCARTPSTVIRARSICARKANRAASTGRRRRSMSSGCPPRSISSDGAKPHSTRHSPSSGSRSARAACSCSSISSSSSITVYLVLSFLPCRGEHRAPIDRRIRLRANEVKGALIRARQHVHRLLLFLIAAHITGRTFTFWGVFHVALKMSQRRDGGRAHLGPNERGKGAEFTVCRAP